jgi:hypothetical protein
MCCLDIVGVVISPRRAYALGRNVIRHDFIAMSESSLTDSAFHSLLDNLTSQQLPHFGGRPEFTISSGVMRVINTLDGKARAPFLLFSPTAEEGAVNRTAFIASKFHHITSQFDFANVTGWDEQR